MSRFVDRGAITAYVGIGMAVTIGVSFLLVIPIEPIYWLLAPLAGLMIGYYANQRANRGRGAWRRVIANSLFAGLVTGLTLAALLLAVKVLFFTADDGYRDPSLGGQISCTSGGDCVYQRYLLAGKGPGSRRDRGHGSRDVLALLLEPAAHDGRPAARDHDGDRAARRPDVRDHPAARSPGRGAGPVVDRLTDQ